MGLGGKLVLATAAAVICAGALSLRPWQKLSELKRSIKAESASLAEVRREKSDQMRLNARFDSRPGREELARSKGFRSPSERPLGDLLPPSE